MWCMSQNAKSDEELCKEITALEVKLKDDLFYLLRSEVIPDDFKDTLVELLQGIENRSKEAIG